MSSFTFEDIALNKKQSSTVRKFLTQKETSNMWKYIDSLNLPISNSLETELIFTHRGAFIRNWKHNKYDSRSKN